MPDLTKLRAEIAALDVAGETVEYIRRDHALAILDKHAAEKPEPCVPLQFECGLTIELPPGCTSQNVTHVQGACRGRGINPREERPALKRLQSYTSYDSTQTRAIVEAIDSLTAAIRERRKP